MSGFFADQGRLPTSLEEAAHEEIPRDRWDRPLIWPPGMTAETGTKRDMIAYARASSYGGQLEDKSNLELWGKRQMLRGAAIDVDRWRREHAEANGDPAKLAQITSTIIDRVPLGPARERGGEIQKRDKDTLNRLVDQADELVGSQDKASLGTAIHLATELVDLGESLDGLSPFLKNRAEAYWRATRELGLTFTAIERFGVEDVNQVAGTTDRIGYAPFWGTRLQVVQDVKTSGSMDFAGIGFGVQLATYAHMVFYSPDGTRTPHENMNMEKALIIHVSRELDGHVEFFAVDIAAGWREAQLARAVVLARRNGKKMITPLDLIEAAIESCYTYDELNAVYQDTGHEWTKFHKELANERHAYIGGFA